MPKVHRRKHVGFGYKEAASLNHDNRALGTGDNQVQIRLGLLRKARVDYKFTLNAANAHCANGAIPRDIGDCECCRSGDNTPGIWYAVKIHRKRHYNNLNVIAHTIREQGAKGSINQTGGENSFFGWAATALDKSAWDFTNGVLSLFIITGEGEEIDTRAQLFAHRGCGLNNGIAD